MRNKLYILIVLTALYSCSNKEIDPLNEIKLGMTVENVLEKLNIESDEVHVIEEPILIYRGINATLKDSTEIGISFDRTAGNLDSITEENELKVVSKLKINGFAWKKKNGENERIGQLPIYWVE